MNKTVMNFLFAVRIGECSGDVRLTRCTAKMWLVMDILADCWKEKREEKKKVQKKTESPEGNCGVGSLVLPRVAVETNQHRRLARLSGHGTTG